MAGPAISGMSHHVIGCPSLCGVRRLGTPGAEFRRFFPSLTSSAVAPTLPKIGEGWGTLRNGSSNNKTRKRMGHPPALHIRQPIKDAFDSDGRDAVTGTPSYPLMTFFRATSISYASLGRNIGNESTIFHEALHGITGQQDATILTNLGMDWSTHPSCSISLRIQNAVLKQSASLDSSNSWNCPNAVGDE